MNPLVVIQTTAYPYGSGEHFLAEELEVWARSGARVVLLPTSTSGPARSVPEGVEVDLTMARRWQSRPGVAAALAGAAADPALRAELADLRRRGTLSRATALTALKGVAQVRALADALGEVAAARGPIDVAYTYWLKPFTAGALRARDAGHVRVVVSRAHGSDLYEQARAQQYNPLVRTLAVGVDGLYPISEQGCGYAVEQYGFTPERVTAAPLGIRPTGDIAPPATGDALRVVSISSINRLKRIDLLAEALAEVRASRPDLALTWTHFGDGPLREGVETIVRERLTGAGVVLRGQVPHDELLAALSAPADLMVNTSSSEGVPVSIMEAGAHGIPCLATDVGATREVVPADYLVPADVTPEVLAGRLLELLPDARSEQRRSAVRAHVLEHFDAEHNHERFVADVLSLVR